ncbi:MAG: hypothetical protein KDD10_18725 [Phaeodactylibacter sp.]|nr:hypothetical protein [Phaeodactylibacter sp.]MCB9295277.1 hypothetical protein [Lewinellaceae bacterium]
MRKVLAIVVFCTACAGLVFTSSACNRKVGCPANEAAHVKPNRKGELPTSGGKTRLFPKDFNRKTKKRN